jgi:DNA-binding LacI/PurR family transcriptional regulator
VSTETQHVPRKRPTANDVALRAGVSRTTVSYVLNGRTDVTIPATTRAQVFAAAEELDYHPSPAARALRVGHGEVVLVLLPGWAAGQFADVLAALGGLISKQGLVCLRHEGTQWEGQLAGLLGRVTAAVVVTMEPLRQVDAEALARAGVPEVRLWWRDHPGQPRTSVLDQAEIVRLQVDHLLERGFTRLAYLALDAPSSRSFQEVRIAAFEEICRDRRVRSPLVAVEPEDLDAVTARLSTWTRRTATPLGVCGWSDVTAMAVLQAAQALGLRVPDQVGVVGVDDSPVARLARPAISSVSLDLAQEAAGLAGQIGRLLKVDLPTEASALPAAALVARAST